MRPLDIKIMSLDDCSEFTKQKSNFNIVSIRSSYRTPKEIYFIIDNNKDNYDSIIIETFDDVERREPMYVEPNEEHIKRILDHTSKIGNNFVVHCTAGISRSSAIAYLIGCQKVGKEKAIKYIDFWNHTPNQLVVTLGSKVLKDKTIFPFLLEKGKEHYEKNKKIYDQAFAKARAFFV